jgi:hypothetical protein
MKMTVRNLSKLFILSAEPLSGYMWPEPKNLAHGFCFYFAYAFHKILGAELYTYKKISLYCTPGVEVIHAFVKYRGKFYDGDNLSGTDGWVELQPYFRLGQTCDPQPLSEFLTDWEISPESLAKMVATCELIKENVDIFKKEKKIV